MRTLIHACLGRRWLVVAVALLFVVFGAFQVHGASFDAFPEFAPPRIELQTEAPGLTSEEVEQLITAPLESELAGLPGLTKLRSKSVLGLSSLVLWLDPAADSQRTRALVQERLNRIAPQLPSIARPPAMLSPLSATSRVLKVGLWSRERDQLALTDLARWVVRPRLMAVPGVANVGIWGQRDRQLQVQVEPNRLAAHEVSLDRLTTALRKALLPRAGGFVDTDNQRFAVAHPLPIAGVRDLSNLPVFTAGVSTLRVGDLATVTEHHAPPIGDALVTQGRGLLLIVEKQLGANTLEVTRGLDAVLANLRPALPGVEIDATIFRPSDFIARALHNLGKAIGIGCALVLLVLFAFLWDVRTALISMAALPLSLLSATLVLDAFGHAIDTMVIAGLAIALGEVVDDAIIDVENIHRRLARAERPLSRTRALSIVLEASLEVRSAIVFASLVVLLVFVPIFFLDGVAGSFFRPLALAYGLAVGASTLVALTVTPALALILLPRGRSASSPVANWLLRVYAPLLVRLLRRPSRVWASAGCLAIATLVAAVGLRAAFLPAFQENDLLMHWIARPGSSLEAVAKSADRARAALLAVPGVRNFGTHIGRAELGDEVVGPNFAELWISVDPEAELSTTLARVKQVIAGIPGVYRDVQTYLQERMREVLSGGSGAIIARVYGSDLAALRATASKLAEELSGVRGVLHAKPEAQVLVPQLEVRPDLARCAMLGVDPGIVRARVSSAIQGEVVGQIMRGGQPLDVVVQGPSVRDPLAIAELTISIDDQRSLRVRDVASVAIVPVPNTIAHEAGSRKLDVVLDIDASADLDLVAEDVQARVAALPSTALAYVEILGEHQARQRARQRLAIAALFALFGIAAVLYADFRSLRISLLVLASFPFALVGAVFAALLAGGVVSLGTLVGMVTVVGIAARNGIMLIAHYRSLEEQEGVPFGDELIVRGSKERLAPIVMTALATGLALVPLLWRLDAPGHEIEGPMAVVILGGLVSSTLLNLFIMPVLYRRFGRTRK